MKMKEKSQHLHMGVGGGRGKMTQNDQKLKFEKITFFGLNIVLGGLRVANHVLMYPLR